LLGADLRRAATERIFGFRSFRPTSSPISSLACSYTTPGAARRGAGWHLSDKRPYRLGAQTEEAFPRDAGRTTQRTR
jgi:hypothetical protein